MTEYIKRSDNSSLQKTSITKLEIKVEAREKEKSPLGKYHKITKIHQWKVKNSSFIV